MIKTASYAAQSATTPQITTASALAPWLRLGGRSTKRAAAEDGVFWSSYAIAASQYGAVIFQI